jgi:hypothetical protein
VKEKRQERRKKSGETLGAETGMRATSVDASTLSSFENRLHAALYARIIDMTSREKRDSVSESEGREGG